MQEKPPQPQPQLATLETKPKPAGHGRSVCTAMGGRSVRCNVALCSFSLKQFLKHFSTQAEAEAKEATLHATLFFYAFVTTINVLYVPLAGSERRRGGAPNLA